MDPITLTVVTAGLQKTLPALTRVMTEWMAQKVDRSLKLQIADKSGVQLVNITPENIEALLLQNRKEAGEVTDRDSDSATGGVSNSDDVTSSGGVFITGGTVHTGGGDIVGRDKKIEIEGPITGALPTERPDPEALKISLVQATLVRMRTRLSVELPRARSRQRLAKRIRLSGSLAALTSNVGVLGSLGLGNATASVIAAVIALLVSGLKTIEDYLIAGVTGKEPQRLQELVIETNRLWYEANEILATFGRLSDVQALPESYPLGDADRVAKDLIRLLPEMELAGD